MRYLLTRRANRIMPVVTVTAILGSAAILVGPAFGTPLPNAATIEVRTFNDCPTSTLTTTTNFPTSIQITDEMDPACVGFANLHSWSFSEDGGASAAVFDNASTFSFGADFSITGAGEGEGGLRVSPWFAQFSDGRFTASAITGEIVAFGGRLPFFNFTDQFGIHYIKGTTIRMEVLYLPNGLSATHPAMIRYRVVSGGITYQSPLLLFDEGNPAEDPPYGLWGILNDARVGGLFQPRANTGASLTGTWSNITFDNTPCVAMALTVSPQVLSKKATGGLVTAFLEPPAGYAASDIDVASILFNRSVPVAPGAPTVIDDFDADGKLELKVKVSRSQLLATLEPGEQVEVAVRGLIAGDCFEGTTTVRVRA